MDVLKKMNLKVTVSELKRALGLTLIIMLLVSGFFVIAEPNIMFASVSASQTVVVTLVVDAGISVNVDSLTTAMSTHLGVVANTAVATSTFVVATNGALGYTFQVTATSTPAMTNNGTNNLPDATPTQALYASLIPAGTYAFGFSAYSTSTTNVATATWGTQTTGCAQGAGTSTPSTGLKYRGFTGSTPITVASNTGTTTTVGNPIVICFVAGQNGSYIPAGNYNATITGTATTN